MNEMMDRMAGEKTFAELVAGDRIVWNGEIHIVESINEDADGTFALFFNDSKTYEGFNMDEKVGFIDHWTMDQVDEWLDTIRAFKEMFKEIKG